MNNKLMLLILDGLGLADSPKGNAVTAATMPYFYALMAKHPVSRLEASGEPVGLDQGQVGNSEVGHATIGAGRVLKSKLAHIEEQFNNGHWAQNNYWEALKQQSRIHIAGVLSEAGVHAHINAMIQTITLAVEQGIAEINLHLFVDGLDSPANSAPQLLNQLNQAIADFPQVRIGVIMGRIWAADRSGDLSVTQHCVDALKATNDLPTFTDEALAEHIQAHGSERDFAAHIVNRDTQLLAGESIILTNHRTDRVKQLCEVLLTEHQVYSLADLTAVEQAKVFFPVAQVDGGLIDQSLSQGANIEVVAEACKFKHVTYFLNGFKENNQVIQTEIPTIDDQAIRLNPAMSIEALEAAIVAAMQRTPDLLCVNIPNLDQVGHTGDMALTEQAAEWVDQCLARLMKQAAALDYTVAITADHGNADAMLSDSGKALVSHSGNPVPFMVIPPELSAPVKLQPQGSLANIAPTLLKLMDIPIPAHMHPDLQV